MRPWCPPPPASGARAPWEENGQKYAFGFRDSINLSNKHVEGGYLVLDQWQLQKLCQVLHQNEVWLYTEGLDHDTQRELFVHPLDSVEEGIRMVLDRFGPDAKIAVVPEGPYVLAQCGCA